MPIKKLNARLSETLAALEREGRLKGPEDVIESVIPPDGRLGARYRLAGEPAASCIKMDSNSYLGLSLDERVISAAHEGAGRFGAGPGSVRFIHGTCELHVRLEEKLAGFHRREAGIIFSSAYAAVCGVICPLVSGETIVISDELNHNSIINALRMGKPAEKKIYAHLDMEDLERKIKESSGRCRRLMIVTDGVFSMRGDYPDLARLEGLAEAYDGDFEEGVVTVMDDSHGMGAFGETGRGTAEVAGGKGADITVSTLGKALGVNGGYAVSSLPVVSYLRETSPFYLYSNPLTPGEAAAALRSLEILDSEAGREKLFHLRRMTGYFRKGLEDAGYEVLPGEHPIIAVMVRDGGKTAEMVKHLRANGILAAGLNFPVVPRGDECVRFQVNACQTRADLDCVLGAMKRYKDGPESRRG